MRILVIEPRSLFPPDTGAKILSGNVLRHLARQHEVTLVMNVDGAKRDDEAAKHSDLCREFVPVRWKEMRNFTPRFYVELAWCLATGRLYMVSKFCTSALRRAAREQALTGRHDVAVCDTVSTFMPDVDFGGTPRIVLAHNMEHVLRMRQAERSHGLRAAYVRHYARKTREFEERSFRGADEVVTVSPADAEYVRQEMGIEHVSSLPAGVDVEYFAPCGEESSRPTLVFTGSMDWQANQDAVRFFVGEVLPSVKGSVSDVRFVVVGRRPPAEIRALAERDPEHVEVTGTVDDVRPYLAEAHVAVVPVLFGSGVKIKVFEAMAMGKAVVLSRIGAEGLPVTDGVDVVVADSAGDMAARCVELLRDAERRRALGARARATVLAGHDWAVVARELAGICERVAGRRRTP